MQSSGPIARVFQVIALLFLIFTMAGPWLVTQDGVGWVRRAALWITGAGLVLFFLWVYRLFGRKRVIENPVSRQMLVQTFLFGMELNRTEAAAAVPQVWQGSPAREMRYPASVVELYREGNASDLISTALLQLIAQGDIQIGITRVSKRIGRGRKEYRIIRGEGKETSEIKGELERRLISAVDAGQGGGISLEELVVTVLDGEQDSPRNFLVEEIIGPEAEELGLGDVRGNLKKSLVPAPNSRGRVARDIQSLEMLYRDFWVTMPEHAPLVLGEIDRVVIRQIRPG